MKFLINVPNLLQDEKDAVQIPTPDGSDLWLPRRELEVQLRLDGRGIDLIMPEKYMRYLGADRRGLEITWLKEDECET